MSRRHPIHLWGAKYERCTGLTVGGCSPFYSAECDARVGSAHAGWEGVVGMHAGPPGLGDTRPPPLGLSAVDSAPLNSCATSGLHR